MVVRKGKAGSVKFLPKGKYTLTDDAYILFLKDEYEGKLRLNWFVYQYSNVFIDYASNSDNGTWNMTGFFENVIIDIPDIVEQQLIIDEYNKLNKIESLLRNIETKIEFLFSRILVNEP